MKRRIKRNIERNIESKKITANYKRTSTGSQDLDLQDSSNLEYIQEKNIQDVIDFTDFDVSANKLSIVERPALYRMLDLVKQGVVKRIVVYKRDRLARNVYEHRYLSEIFLEHNVEVIFTSEKEPPFSDDIYIETWYGLVAQFEGRNIDARTNEARKINPPSLIGYKKTTIEDPEKNIKRRVYKAVDGLSEELNNLFQEASEARNLEDLFNVITKYEKVLKRDSDRILGILRTPFFAAHYSKDNELRPLSHVDPIISIDLYKKVQEVLDSYQKGVYHGNAIKSKELFLTPICGTCKRDLKFRQGNIGQRGFYFCTKHKHSIDIDELEHFIRRAIKNFFANIDTAKLEKILNESVDQQVRFFNQSIDEVIFDLEDICLDTTKRFKTNEQSEQLMKQMHKISTIRDKISELQKNVRNLKQLKGEVTTIVEYGKNGMKQMNQSEIEDMAQLIIDKIEVHENLIHLQLYFNEFLIEGDKSVAT